MENKNFININEKEITETYVYFTSDHTTYANERKVPTHDVKSLLKRCTKVCKQLKEKGCKVSHKYKTRKELIDNIDQYNNEVIDYNHNFGMLVNYANWITSKPLPVGTSDNEELNTMYEFRNNCMKALYRNTMLSKVTAFALKLEELEKALQDPDFSYSAVYF
ncbi:coil containing protein [Vibrio phage 1.170.O._10N.261.52.C3]|nr:coil containing protein [Vibrio phage 1.170.O._10N.261.52.C3]